VRDYERQTDRQTEEMLKTVSHLPRITNHMSPTMHGIVNRITALTVDVMFTSFSVVSVATKDVAGIEALAPAQSVGTFLNFNV